MIIFFASGSNFKLRRDIRGQEFPVSGTRKENRGARYHWEDFRIHQKKIFLHIVLILYYYLYRGSRESEIFYDRRKQVSSKVTVVPFEVLCFKTRLGNPVLDEFDWTSKEEEVFSSKCSSQMIALRMTMTMK